jgi:hypothetical protein
MLQHGHPSRALYRIVGRMRAEGQLPQRHRRDQDRVRQFGRVKEPERGDDAGVDDGSTMDRHRPVPFIRIAKVFANAVVEVGA